MLKKINLNEKLSQLVLYSRKKVLGVGLMASKTIVSTLVLKLHADHNRIRSEMSKFIRINIENARVY